MKLRKFDDTHTCDLSCVDAYENGYLIMKDFFGEVTNKEAEELLEISFADCALKAKNQCPYEVTLDEK